MCWGCLRSGMVPYSRWKCSACTGMRNAQWRQCAQWARFHGEFEPFFPEEQRHAPHMWL